MQIKDRNHESTKEQVWLVPFKHRVNGGHGIVLLLQAIFGLYRLCKFGKANLGVSDIEYSVVVGHEGVTEDPELATDAGVAND